MELILKVNGKYRSLNRVLKAVAVAVMLIIALICTNYGLDAEDAFKQACLQQWLAK